MARTSDELVSQVQLTTAIPSNQAFMTPDRVLAFANEEIEGKIYPIVDACNQEYFIKTMSVPIVAGQDKYQIPVRALGRTLRDLKIQEVGGSRIRNMVMVKLEDAHYFTYQATPTSFYFMGDSVVVIPTPSTSNAQTLLMYYFERPGRLISGVGAAKVTDISDVSLNRVTVDHVPTALTLNSTVDFVQAVAGNSTLAIDVTLSAISTTLLTFSSVPTNISVGDYIAPAGFSPVLQFPEEGFDYAVGLVSLRCLLAVGDTDGASALASTIAERKKLFELLIAPRIQGENIKIINRNGLLRGNRSRFGRGILYP